MFGQKVALLVGVILLWVYYSAQIVFFGAEFTKVYSRRFDPSRRLIRGASREP